MDDCSPRPLELDVTMRRNMYIKDEDVMVELDESDWSSMTSLTDSSFKSEQKPVKQLIQDYEDLKSMDSGELNQQITQQEMWMNKIFSKTKKVAQVRAQRERAKLMVGKTRYDFPGKDVFENIIEEETKIDL